MGGFTLKRKNIKEGLHVVVKDNGVELSRLYGVDMHSDAEEAEGQECVVECFDDYRVYNTLRVLSTGHCFIFSPNSFRRYRKT